MILETERSHSVMEMAKNAQKTITQRSLGSIMHKLQELLSQEEMVSDVVDIEGETFPAHVVSGYVIITLPDATKIPAHHYVWTKHYGSIPKGYHIHHRNSKRTDNSINNLCLMSSDDHVRYHQSGRPPETFALFCYLQHKGLWQDYLSYREEVIKMLERAAPKKP